MLGTRFVASVECLLVGGMSVASSDRVKAMSLRLGPMEAKFLGTGSGDQTGDSMAQSQIVRFTPGRALNSSRTCPRRANWLSVSGENARLLKRLHIASAHAQRSVQKQPAHSE